MALFLLIHRHPPEQCGAAFSSWRGFDSPLRHRPALSSCVLGGHAVWWTVAAGSEELALAQLPPYVADRTEAVEVREASTP